MIICALTRGEEIRGFADSKGLMCKFVLEEWDKQAEIVGIYSTLVEPVTSCRCGGFYCYSYLEINQRKDYPGRCNIVIQNIQTIQLMPAISAFSPARRRGLTIIISDEVIGLNYFAIHFGKPVWMVRTQSRQSTWYPAISYSRSVRDRVRWSILTISPAMTRTWKRGQSEVWGLERHETHTIDQWWTQWRLANHNCRMSEKARKGRIDLLRGQ